MQYIPDPGIKALKGPKKENRKRRKRKSEIGDEKRKLRTVKPER
jgi:hypothetical protein